MCCRHRAPWTPERATVIIARALSPTGLRISPAGQHLEEALHSGRGAIVFLCSFVAALLIRIRRRFPGQDVPPGNEGRQGIRGVGPPAGAP